MSSETKRQAWYAQAEQIYEEARILTGLEQSEHFRTKLDNIQNPNDRSAIEMMVWYWIREGKEETVPQSKELLSPDTILVATFLIMFLVGWFELRMSLIWSGFLALFTTFVLRFAFRMFDRGFLFRRLFITCVGSGLFLIAPAQFQFNFETPYGPISWGGAPEGALVMIWVICTLLTFAVAVWEHMASGRT